MTSTSLRQHARLIAVVGPTASGKTARAVALARALDGEVISADSRQVYRGMDLGTGKDLDEYGDVAYHLIDIVPAGQKYNLHRYLADYHRAVDDVRRHGHLPVVCGGSGLYVESAINGITLPDVPENRELRQRLDGLDMERLTEILRGYGPLHNVTDLDSPRRAVRAIEIADYMATHPDTAAGTRPNPEADTAVIGVDIDRDTRRRRISERLRARLEAGMTAEVERLLAEGVDAESLIYYGLEYKYVTLYVTGRLSREEMFTQLETAIHQFAKRQMTWFRGMERRGIAIHWLPYDLPEDEFTGRVAEIAGLR